MQIQLDKVWLFETTLTNPFFLGEKDGITAKLIDNRVISDLEVNKESYSFDSLAKAGLTCTVKYGGEDYGISDSYGKSKHGYQLEINVPTNDLVLIESIVGRELSLVGVKRDRSIFSIFGLFNCESVDIDNLVMQRLRFSSKNTNARIFEVINLKMQDTELIGPGLLNNAFEYTLDFSL